MLFDSHAHLLSLENMESVIENMKKDNLAFIINAGTTIKNSEEGARLASKYDGVYATIALYPEYAENWDKDCEKALKTLAKNPKVVGVGEIGLDYHGENINREKQIEVFEKQIKIAYENDLPICVHCRKAVEDMYEILCRNKYIFEKGVLMHCFSENMEYTKKLAELGCYFSFSGNITYKKVDTERVKVVGVDKILVETDCPYLSPVPLRGTLNEPANVKYTAQKIADILEISLDEFSDIALKNAKRFFKKIK